MIRIVSNGDGAVGTYVENEDGSRIKGIVRIEIEPIDARDDAFVTAKLTILASMDIRAEVDSSPTQSSVLTPQSSDRV